jgi:hypothetical protein
LAADSTDRLAPLHLATLDRLTADGWWGDPAGPNGYTGSAIVTHRITSRRRSR